MIDILISPTGDRAEADDPASALLAARTMIEDAKIGVQGESRKFSATFLVGGTAIRCNVPERDLR